MYIHHSNIKVNKYKLLLLPCYIEFGFIFYIIHDFKCEGLLGNLIN